MEKYTVSRPLAERLRQAGYPQKTQFGWEFDMDDNGNHDGYFVVEQVSDGAGNYLTATPLSDELLEQFSVHDIDMYKDTISKTFHASIREFMDYTKADKLADALAELWLWCHDNGYLGSTS